MADENLIITIRVIRSFHHRNLKNLVLRNVNKNISVKDLKQIINDGMVFYSKNKQLILILIRNKKKQPSSTI